MIRLFLRLAVVALALLAFAPVGAGEPDAPALIEKARVAISRDDHKVIGRLVAADRIAAYEAVDLLLLDEATAFDPLIDALADAYLSVTGEGCLRARAVVIRKWTPEQRRRHTEALARRELGREALQQGRMAEARKAAEETFVVFQETEDLRLIGRSLAGFAALAA